MSRWGAACLAIKAAMVASLYSATESSEQANCTATLKSPSFSLVETLVAKEQGGWDLLVRHSGGGALEPEFMVSVGSLSSANCSLARFHRHPPLSATRRHLPRKVKWPEVRSSDACQAQGNGWLQAHARGLHRPF